MTQFKVAKKTVQAVKLADALADAQAASRCHAQVSGTYQPPWKKLTMLEVA